LPCTLRRSSRPRAHRRDRLRPGLAAAPDEPRLALLPSGPDAVRVSPLRGTRSSAPFTPAALEDEDLGREFSPAGADCRYRAPLVPRLARHRDHSRGAGMDPGCGGEGGIRTLDGLPHTAFPVRRPRPLGDLSAGTSARGPAGRVRVAWRRGWDSNPRCLRTPLFESGTFNHSDTSPVERIPKAKAGGSGMGRPPDSRGVGSGTPGGRAGPLAGVQASAATAIRSAASARRIPETRSIRRESAGWSASWITEPAAPADALGTA
jgi:hypothetical protein